MSIAITEETALQQRLKVRVLSASEMDSQFIDQWEQLEDRAVEPNAFLSPHFVLPAVRHLSPTRDVVFLAIESETEFSSALVGLGVFERSRGTLVAPFPHLVAYTALGNTFLTNLLVDQACSRDVLTAFFEFLTTQSASWQCIEFLQRSADSRFSRELTEVAGQFGMHWIGWEYERPLLRPRTTTPEQAAAFLSRNRRNRISKSKRQLELIGNVSLEVIRCGHGMSPYAENFLRLEDIGWKGAVKSSMRSRPETEAFFLEMAEGFANANRMLFSELRVDDRVICTTSNFVAGNAGFGFKFGWDPEFQQNSPGVLQAVEFAKASHRELHDLDYFDSCSVPDSFIQTLWPDKRTLTSGAFVSSRISKLAVSGMLQLRVLKRKWKNRKASAK